MTSYASVGEVRDALNRAPSSWRSFETVWVDAVRFIDEFADVREDIPTSTFPTSVPAEVLKVVDRARDTLGDDEPLSLFDTLFARLNARSTGRAVNHERLTGVLATPFAVNARQFADYFMTSADLAVSVAEALDEVAHPARAFYRFDRYRALGIQCAVHGLELKTDSGPLARPGFILIDPPKRGGPRRRSSGGGRNKRSLFALSDLIDEGRQFDLAMVIVARSDAATTAAGDLRRERERLIRERRLLAVMDLPDKARHSAWLVSGRPDVADRVLFMDSALLRSMAGPSGAEAVIRFMADVCLRSLDVRNDEPYYWTHARGRVESLEILFGRYFTEEYGDFDGICRKVSYDEILLAGMSLRASDYVGSAPARVLNLLDGEPVFDLLADPHAGHACAFVIGNNGAGKSLLLRHLVERFTGMNWPVIGIAFGVTDRFPHVKDGEAGSFSYRGARTGARSVSLEMTARQLFRAVVKVHTDGFRLGILEDVLRVLGFRAQRVLLPVGMHSGTKVTEELASGIFFLGGDAERNEAALSRLPSQSYKLGLQRGPDGSIVPFDELSSGEQHLLVMAIKLIAEAGEGSVVLIDEPELSLHVGWQVALPGILALIRRRLGCQMVVATHSPIVIASASGDDDHCFLASDGVLERLDAEQRRSVEGVLMDGFRTYTPHNRGVYEECAGLVAEGIQHANIDDEAGMRQFIASSKKKLKQMKVIVDEGLTRSGEMDRRDADLIQRTVEALEEMAAASLDGGVLS